MQQSREEKVLHSQRTCSPFCVGTYLTTQVTHIDFALSIDIPSTLQDLTLLAHASARGG